MCKLESETASASSSDVMELTGPHEVDMRGKTRQRLDASRPVVHQVGWLGDHEYWLWVHQPEAGSPRFFASSLAEVGFADAPVVAICP